MKKNPIDKKFLRFLKALSIFMVISIVVETGILYLLKSNRFSVVISSISDSLRSTKQPVVEPTIEKTIETSQAITETPQEVPTPTITPTPSVGTFIISPIDGMKQLFVPEGIFLMGADISYTDSNPDQYPQREVYLNAFWIDETEITNEMYCIFLNSSNWTEEEISEWIDIEDPDLRIELRGQTWVPRTDYKFRNYPGARENDTRILPASEITWFGAQAYCEWAGRRLPTEAEWEKAGRGTDGRKYPWGNNTDVCCTCSGCGYRGFSELDIGQWPEGKSPYGALDMIGSVWEYVSDFYDPNYFAVSPLENPKGPEGGQYKSIRGGSWVRERLPITVRFYSDPNQADETIGFRCVQDYVQ